MDQTQHLANEFLDKQPLLILASTDSWEQSMRLGTWDLGLRTLETSTAILNLVSQLA